MISMKFRRAPGRRASVLVLATAVIGIPLFALDVHAQTAHEQHASGHSAHQHGEHHHHAAESSSKDGGWTSAEVRKVDLEQGRLTLRHERIESLDMEPMTMVFRLGEGVSAAELSEGAKVRFQVERQMGRLVITALEATP